MKKEKKNAKKSLLEKGDRASELEKHMKIFKTDKHFFITQIVIFFLITGAFGGILVSTDVYHEVEDSIVTVLCLSCLKLDPILKADVEFTFETATGESHPDFILENLSTGIVFLHYSKDACAGCDVMLPTIQDLFSVNYGKEDMFQKQLEINESTIHYYYINIDHTTEEKEITFPIYDKDFIEGLPMFTIVTLFYDHGTIKPYYTSLYGTLGPENDTHEKRYNYLTDLINYTIGLWNENLPGYYY
jgi:hypothetical protein